MVEIGERAGKAFPASKRVCLVQLPVPDPNFASARANVPLAAACLKAACAGIDREIDIAPEGVVDRGGDERVLGWILDGGYDAVCFTLYLWNRERSAWMAGKLKEANPSILCAAGGPEVQDDTQDADLSVFDALIAGEGEEAFSRLLGGVGRYRGCFSGSGTERPATSPVDAIQPYLSGALPMVPGRPVFLETMRGCPRSCAYCHYGRNSGAPRYLPVEAVERVIRKAREGGVDELYLMDPDLAARPGFEDFLSLIGRWNGKAMRIHAELSLECVTAERARLMEEAGIGSVEAGLQSVNPKALKAVGRPWDRGRFESGARLLAERGIEAQLGLIIGLPHDGLGEIEASMGYVADLGLQDAAGAYPLALLPGTELRSRAAEYGMTYMKGPPYYLLSNDWLSPERMRQAVGLTRDLWGREPQEPIRPRFDSGAEPAEFIDARGKYGPERLARGEGLSYSLTILLGPPGDADRSGLLRHAARLKEAAPFTQYQLVWTAAPGRLPDPVDVDIVTAAFSRPPSLADRLRHFTDEAACGARRFFLARDEKQAIDWADGGGGGEGLILDLVANPALSELAADYDWEILPFILTRRGEALAGGLAGAYEGFDDLIIESGAIA